MKTKELPPPHPNILKDAPEHWKEPWLTSFLDLQDMYRLYLGDEEARETAVKEVRQAFREGLVG